METLASLALTPIFGKPVILWGGLATLALFLIAEIIAVINKKKPGTFSYPVHIWVARIAILFALIHALFGMSIFWK